MTLNQFAEEWDEITMRLKGMKKDIEAKKAQKKMTEYCNERRNCEGCAIRKYCNEERRVTGGARCKKSD